MTREELETELDIVVVETASLSKKDRDRLVDALATFVVEELDVELVELDDIDDNETEED